MVAILEELHSVKCMKLNWPIVFIVKIPIKPTLTTMTKSKDMGPNSGHFLGWLGGHFGNGGHIG